MLNVLLSHAAEFSQAVDAYRQDLALGIQNAEIHLGIRATFMPAKVPYGPSRRPVVESVLSTGPKLENLRGEFESALKTKDLVGAQKLSEKIRSGLVNQIAI